MLNCKPYCHFVLKDCALCPCVKILKQLYICEGLNVCQDDPGFQFSTQHSAVHTAQLHFTSKAAVNSDTSHEIVIFQLIHWYCHNLKKTGTASKIREVFVNGIYLLKYKREPPLSKQTHSVMEERWVRPDID